MEHREAMVYTIIEQKTGSNVLMQGLTGIVGFPWTLLADVGVVFTHYGPMLNEIRGVYGRESLTKEVLGPIIKGYGQELIADLVLDKIVGQIPIIGIASNMICAKAMTWRLGILFGMLAARGEEVDASSVGNCTMLIRQLFPQSKSIAFKKPSVVVVSKLLTNLEGISQDSFDKKVMSLLDSLEQIS